MIKVVLFDFGGVLTAEGGKQGFVGQTIAELFGIAYDSVDIGDLHGDLRRGKISDDVFFAELNKRYGLEHHVAKEEFLQKTTLACVPAEEVYGLAGQLRRQGIRTAILSNIFAMNARILREQGWYKDFEPLILSCDEGFAKPDPEIYEVAVRRLGVSPAQILFIDDQEKCLSPAKGTGMQTIKANNPAQIVADIKNLLRHENGIEL